MPTSGPKIAKEIEFSISSRLPTSINYYFLCTWDDVFRKSSALPVEKILFQKRGAEKRNDITSNNAHNNAYFQAYTKMHTIESINEIYLCLKF